MTRSLKAKLSSALAIPVASALIVLAPSGASAATQKPCVLSQFASLNMLTLPNGEFSVPMNVKGQMLQMMVDTGSKETSLTEETVEQLGVKWMRAATQTTFVNNVGASGLAKVDSLGLGPLHVNSGITVVVIPNQLVPLTYSGLLGPDILQNYDIEMDFYHGKFGVFAPNQCHGHVVYWTHGGYAELTMTRIYQGQIFLDAKLDGKIVNVILDTGSASSFMSADKARALFGLDEKDSRIQSAGVSNINGGNTVQNYTYPFGSLEFDGISVKHPQIELIPQKNFFYENRFNTDVVIGMSILRQMHIYVAYDDEKVYLTDAEAH